MQGLNRSTFKRFYPSLQSHPKPRHHLTFVGLLQSRASFSPTFLLSSQDLSSDDLSSVIFPKFKFQCTASIFKFWWFSLCLRKSKILQIPLEIWPMPASPATISSQTGLLSGPHGHSALSCSRALAQIVFTIMQSFPYKKAWVISFLFNVSRAFIWLNFSVSPLSITASGPTVGT